MTKREAMLKAAEYGVAVYRSDTAATIVARINAHLAAIAERRASVPRRLLAAFAVRRTYRLRFVQLALPLAAPRDWSVCTGRIA